VRIVDGERVATDWAGFQWHITPVAEARRIASLTGGGTPKRKTLIDNAFLRFNALNRCVRPEAESPELTGRTNVGPGPSFNFNIRARCPILRNLCTLFALPLAPHHAYPRPCGNDRVSIRSTHF
jgi:hypothetical protein